MVEPTGPLPLDEGLADVRRPLDILWSNFVNVEGRDPDCVRLLFTAPEHGTGTTTLACCTALGLARNLEDPVALVETNLYAPAMASYLGLERSPGLSDVLDGRAEAHDAVRNSRVPGLYVLTAGSERSPKQGELFREPALSVFRQLVDGRRYVIIDAPPIVERPETRVQLELADWIVLVLRARSTRKPAVRQAQKIIQESGVPILGAIVNRFDSDLPFGSGASEWK